MENDIRESGIDIIGNILWGTHIGQIYSTKEEYFAIAAPYIQRGLMNNELCVWIHGKDMGCEDVKDIIGGYCRDIDIYLESGQLRIIPYTEWYMTGNSFNEVRVNRQWNELVRHALDKGYDGLRAVADTSWLKKSYFRSFSHYEHSVNKTISELPFTVMCLYNTNKLDAPEVAEIIKNHSYVITSSENGYGLVRNVELLIKDKQLERSERRYKKLVQLIPDCIFIHNEKSIFFCNDSAMNITGIKDHNRLSGMSMLDLVPCEFKESFLMFIKKSLEGNIGCNYMRSRFICKNGENMDAWIITTKYDFQGYPALLSVVRDITPFRKIFELEKDVQKNKELLNNALEYDKMKTEFFSNISHEFKTPLNVILTAIQLLKSQKNQCYEEIRESKYIKAIQQNCYRLLRLVNNLIDLTSIDSNFFEIKRQNYDIIQLVENITMSVVEYARNKNINIIFDTDIEEKVIACDPDQFERIILNLLSNAIKFTRNGGCIWVNIFSHSDKLEISIKDTGIGIAPDMQKCIFDRFQRVDKSLNKHYEGSGMGLSIVKALVEKHGGRITLKSQLGKGSEFIIEIPCVVLEEEENESHFRFDDNGQNRAEKICIEFSDIYL